MYLSLTGCVPLPGQFRPKTSIFPPGDGERQPAWVAYDKRVLAFTGFFEEVEINRNIEEFRVRPVKIYFYLEDDTVQGMILKYNEIFDFILNNKNFE